jgi:hypothetical protein
MLRILTVVFLLLLFGIAGAWGLRWRQERRLAVLWEGLRAPSTAAVERFDPDSITDLPAPAQRFLNHALAPGTGLAETVELTMTGRIALQPGAEKLSFRAQQILTLSPAGQGGLIWRAWVGSGVMRFAGWDRYAAGEGAMRWYLAGVVPIVRAEGVDITRSAAGRVALEVATFLPTALLPQRGARWEAVDEERVRVHLTVGEEALAPLLTIAPEGHLVHLEMDRWDPDGVAPGQPGFVRWAADGMETVGTFEGLTLPTTLRVTKRAGTAEAFSFFEARITGAAVRALWEGRGSR